MSNMKDELTPATLLVTISIVIVFTLLRYKLRLSSTSPPLPPGPRSLPIVGYLPFLKDDLPLQFTNMARIYGPIFKFFVGNKLHVVISAPELVKEVVRDNDDIFANRYLTVAASVVSYGGQDIAFSNNSSNWRKLRKIFVQELLSNKNLEACSSFPVDEVRKTIKNVYSKCGTKIDIRNITFLTAANIIRRMVWENSLDEGADLGDELQVVCLKVAENLGKPNLSDFFPFLAWLDLQGVERALKREIMKLDRIFEKIIEDRIKSNSKMLDDGFGDAKKKDFLHILLQLKDKNDATSLNITQIKSLLSNIMIGGPDASATLIEWAMAEIIKNCKVMKKIQEELAEIVGVNNIVEESHLVKLQHLDATIKETLRLHSVSPLLIPRVPSQDCKVGGYTIPKGSIVFLNAWSIHRDPRYWDNPLEFNPNRFLVHEGTNKCDYIGNNLKFIPFGSGRRVCPGIPLADKMQMFILASILHSFDWNLPEGEEHDLSEKFAISMKKSKRLLAIPSQRLHDVSLYA
ncbi:labd-13Z-ene-9,15,16-triol synthase, chloroplastic-like [Rutidosis leptorrhynchoides]|uniref:labd-13Z-ene-9,15,16-triol synthase, chloroplastic-like n=1 Tax=Rutidosis leptorrhynchoides TaxID=125765 RepID=UPI003A9A4E51